jgi:hypothetical protein
MKIPNYICAECRRPFTRRWNANRHCDNKHHGAVENIISCTEFVTNQKDHSSITLNYYEDNISRPTNLKNELFFDQSNYPNNNNSPHNTLSDPLDEALDRELSSYELLEPLGTKYQEMRRVLDFLPEPTKKKLLGNALFSAISSNNPVQTMNKKLIDYRKAKSNVMMLNDLAAFYGKDKAFIKEFLKLKSQYKRK